MNILHLIATEESGGAETVVRDLCSMFNDDRVSSSAIVAGGGWLAGELARVGVPYRVYEYSPFLDSSLIKKIVKYVKDNEIDIIHCHMSQMNIIGSAISRFLGISSIMTFHGISGHFNSRQLIYLYRLASFFPSKLVFVSNNLKELFLQGVPLARSKSIVIYNGINIDHFTSDSANRVSVDSNVFNMVAVGNLVDDKDYSTLIKSCSVLKEKTDKFTLKIAGEGPEEETISESIDHLGLTQNVELLGFHDDISALLASADGYVISSTHEGFSISLVEAMAAGLPVISTSCGGPEEIIDNNVDGLLVDVGDPQALAEKIWSLMNDRKKRETLAEAGQKKVKKLFSLEIMKEQYTRLYESL